MRVTVWNEYRHERNPEHPASRVYPDGMHIPIANCLREAGMEVRVALQEDVLTWWGHAAHQDVWDGVVDRVHRRVLEGMGLVCLHSAHYSKIFKKLMGTSCTLKWREAAERERIWVVERGHPIADGLPEHFVLPHEEMYGETFDIPPPDTLVFISWFQGGEVFRSGCCYHRGRGKVFYFRPGHESYPTYYDPTIQRVIINGVRWAAPGDGPRPIYDNQQPLEQL
jgi:trehalose utilization protein